MVFLRPILENDRERMLDILTDETVRQTYMLPDFASRKDALPLFRRLMDMSKDSAKYVRAIATEGGFVGFLNHTNIQNTSIELGYVTHPDFQDKGYMTEALNLAMEELFALGYQEITTGAFSTNTASIRVMEKCGMVKQAKIDDIEYRGSTHRCIYYKKTRE